MAAASAAMAGIAPCGIGTGFGAREMRVVVAERAEDVDGVVRIVWEGRAGATFDDGQ